jgi:alpha-tubulin suppressor-like RCC1 family protein
VHVRLAGIRSGRVPRLLIAPILTGLLLAGCGGSTKSDVTAIAAGYQHTCAVTTSGTVKCWGANESGQLGNGTTTDSSKPVDVTGLTSKAIAITAGAHHTCALTNAGGVECWGRNDGGQLGNGTNINSSTPVDVHGLASGVTAVAAGSGWVCALTSASGVKCWGWNRFGQLGNGSTDPSSATPTDVAGLTSGVTAISANGLHACALTNDDQVKCWGSTAGTGPASTANQSNVPVDVSGLRDSTAITAGGLHACAITSTGGVDCWGTNHEGELGNGSKTDSYSPVAVSTLTRRASAMAVGSTDDFLPTHSCALTSAGAVKCWGPNKDGQLGNGSTRDRSRPVEVLDLTGGVVAIAVGGSHTCAITTARRLKCWGDNSHGQLGNGSFTISPTAVNVVGF